MGVPDKGTVMNSVFLSGFLCCKEETVWIY